MIWPQTNWIEHDLKTKLWALTGKNADSTGNDWKFYQDRKGTILDSTRKKWVRPGTRSQGETRFFCWVFTCFNVATMANVGKPTGGGCVIAVLGISQLTGLRENLRVQQVMVLTPKYEVLCNFPHPILRMFHHDRIPKKRWNHPKPKRGGLPRVQCAYDENVWTMAKYVAKPTDEESFAPLQLPF